MRNRKIQRQLKKTKEQKLDKYDICGVKDMTPYLAINNIIKKDKEKK